MKHACKKIIALLLVVAMIVGVMPSVFAAQVGPFTDVDDGVWYGEPIQYVYEHKLMNGMSDTTFEPLSNLTRAQAVTVLYRIAGEPVVTASASFTDLVGDWYKNPVAWAEKEGIVNGREDGTFDPEGLIIRNELVTMVWRYAEKPAADDDATKDFPDNDSVAEYAKSAMNWAVANGIINGKDGKLAGLDNTTRAEYAAIIARLDKLLGEDPDPSDDPSEDPDPGIVSIETALAASEGEFTVKGVITLLDGKSVYVQDATGGISFRLAEAPTDLALGDTVITTGNRAEFNGLPQLENATYEKSSGLTLKAKETTIGALSTADVCTYVALKELEVTEVYDNNGAYSSPNVTLKDAAGNTIQLYKAVVEKNADNTWALAVGDKVNVNAAVGIYNTTLQLRNTLATEITKVSVQPTDPTDDPDPTEPPEGEEYALTNELKDGDQVILVNKSVNMAMSTEDSTTSSFNRAGVEVAPADGKLVTDNTAIVWTVEATEGGFFLKRADGAKLSVGNKPDGSGTYNSMGFDQEHNPVWTVVPAATEGCVYVQNTTATGSSGDPKSVEWYADKGNFSVFFVGSADESLFAMEMYVKTTTTVDPTPSEDDIVILYTNDVHANITGKPDGEGNNTTMTYEQIAAYRENLVTANTLLVDAGDAVQGEAVTTLTKGTAVVEVMNAAGYDYAVFGNHEFDYGMDQLLGTLVPAAEYQYLSCNFARIDGTPIEGILPYAIETFDETKVAIIGICTPESFTKSTPTYFQDGEGNYIYTFAQGENGQNLYNKVQDTIDEVREAGADYVVAIAHLGIDEASVPYRSTDVIKNTTGLDVVLDGHSHSTIPGDLVKDKEDNDVLLTSTGTKLNNFGELTISADGTISSRLVNDLTVEADETVKTVVERITSEFEVLLNKVVAKSDVKLTDKNAEGTARAVRNRETNLGDLCADAYRNVMDADIAFVNGGGIRTSIAAGDITYGQIIAVHPFGNMACVVEANGQQILDALEMASRATTAEYVAESKDENGNTIYNAVGEMGGFLQVSGLKYTINAAIESTVVLDDEGMFAGVSGARRVQDVQVLNKETGEYEPIEKDKTYTLASHNYMLKSGGDGINMFMNNKLIQDETKIDNQVLIDYIQQHLNGTVGEAYANLAGEGRITVINEDPGPIDPPEEPKLVKTNFEDIKATDKVIITMTIPDQRSFALLNNGGTQTWGPAAEFDGTTYDETMLWNIVPVEGGYTIYVNGSTDYLYGIAGNNGLRVGTSSDSTNVFNLGVPLEGEGQYLCYVDSAELTRYVGVYSNGQNFRTYAVKNGSLANITNQVLNFYVVSEG